MKFKNLFLFIIPALLICSTAFAKLENANITDITGLEWLQLSMGEKVDHVVASMYALDKKGVPLRRTLQEYYDDIQRKLKFDPNLYHSNLTHILATVAYEKEPGTRKALDQFK